jgi:hypothetical protein
VVRKIISVWLLLIVILGQSGFIINRYHIARLDIQTQIQLSRHNYKEEFLLKLKVPMHLPYYLDQKDYKNTSGEITLKGIVYSYVKSKVKGDTLFLLCLRNVLKTNLISSSLENRVVKSNLANSIILGNTYLTPITNWVYIQPKGFSISYPFLLKNSQVLISGIEKQESPILGIPELPPKALQV